MSEIRALLRLFWILAMIGSFGAVGLAAQVSGGAGPGPGSLVWGPMPSEDVLELSGRASPIRLRLLRPKMIDEQTDLGRSLQGAEPVSMARADFDEDGMPDLAVGFRLEGQYTIRIARGNVDFLFPESAGARARRAEGKLREGPFFPFGREKEIGIAPDFLVAGDFDADGHRDLVLASRDAPQLLWLAGDGSGKFGETRSIELAGLPTFVGTGEIGRPDGLSDLFVGVEGDESARLLVFQDPEGALNTQPIGVSVSENVTTAMEIDIDSDFSVDLAVAAGTNLIILESSEQCLATTMSFSTDSLIVPFDAEIEDLAIGNFAEPVGKEVAVLTRDGLICLFTRTSDGELELLASRHTDQRASGTSTGRSWLVSTRLAGFAYRDVTVIREHGGLEVLPGREDTWIDIRNRAVETEQEDVKRYRFASPANVTRPLAALLNADAQTDLIGLSGGTEPIVVFQTFPIATIVVNDPGNAPDFSQLDGDCDTTPHQIRRIQR